MNTEDDLKNLKDDPSLLANAMLEWEQIQAHADQLAFYIQDAVMNIEQTQTVGNVRVTYSTGRKTYDYEEAATDHPSVSQATIDLYSKRILKIDWKAICTHAGIGEQPNDIKFTQSPPSAKIKLLKK